MKQKHIKIRQKQCDLIALASTCTRRKVGCLIVNPVSNNIISEGYNGPPRDSDFSLCGGSTCLRTSRQIESGTQNDIGCHHAEINAILNACRNGVSTLNTWLFSSCDPCLMCSKAIHHAGITNVYSPLETEVHTEGLQYLKQHNIKLHRT